MRDAAGRLWRRAWLPADFIKAMADPDDPDHEHLAEWIGVQTWDPKVFDFTEVNDRLAEIKLE